MRVITVLASLGSVHIGKNCDQGLENVARGRRPLVASGSIFKPEVTVFPYTD